MFHVINDDHYVSKGEYRLSHCCHEQYDHDRNNMERKINKDRSLLDKPEVETKVLELSLFLLDELVAPDGVVFDINVLDQLIV